MSEFKGTPGPWELAQTLNGLVIRPSYDGDSVCRVHTLRLDRDHQANAKLIAAAPDLLKALERIARDHDCGCVPCTGACVSEASLRITVEEIRELARETISKATA